MESAWLKAVAKELASAISKLSESCVESKNSHRSAHGVAKGVRNIGADVGNALMTVSEGATDATKSEVSVIRLELKDVLRRVWTQVKIEWQADILRIRAEIERSYSDALQNVAIRRAVLHNCMADVSQSLPETTNLVVGFDAETVWLSLSRLKKRSQTRRLMLRLRLVLLKTNDEICIEFGFVIP